MAASLTRTVSGLVFRDGFADLSHWDVHGATEWTANATVPMLTYYQHDRTLLDVTGSGPESATLREPLALRLGGSLYVYYDGGTGDGTAWTPRLAVSSDGGLTMSRRGEMAFPLESGHIEYSPGLIFQSAGAWYFYVLTSDSLDAFGTPTQPYGNHLFTTAATVPDENATWATVSDNDPSLGGAGYDGENGPVASLLDDAGIWKAFTSASGFSPTAWHVGLSTATGPLGPWTHATADLLPVNVQPNGMYPENPRVFWSAAIGRYAMPANALPNPAGAIYYADTLAHFATSGQVIAARVVSPGDAYGHDAWNFWSPVYLPDGSVEPPEADGAVGVVGSGAATVFNSAYGYRLYAGQFEPAPSCALFLGASVDRTMTASPTLPVAWVMECVLEHAAATGNLGVLFALSNPSGDINAVTAYYLDTSPGGTDATLYKAVAGTYTSLGIVAAAPPNFAPTDFCASQVRARVAWDGATIQFAAAGNSASVTPSGPLTGTGIGFRAANLGDARARNLSIYASDTVTLSGLPAGATVALCGANGLPAVVGTADGSGNLNLAHSHFPLYGVRVNGTLLTPDTGPIWGGDSYTFAAPLGLLNRRRRLAS